VYNSEDYYVCIWVTKTTHSFHCVGWIGCVGFGGRDVWVLVGCVGFSGMCGMCGFGDTILNKDFSLLAT